VGDAVADAMKIKAAVHLNFHADPAVAAGIADGAHNEFRTKSQLIRLIVEEWLIKHEYLDGRARR